MKLSEMFCDYRSAHNALMEAIDQICKKAITEYNEDGHSHAKIEKCRIRTSRWYPDQEIIYVDVQLWLAGGWPRIPYKDVAKINGVFREILDKHLSRQKDFDVHSNVQNVTVES